MEENGNCMHEWGDILSPKGLCPSFVSDLGLTKSIADAFSGGDDSFRGDYEREVKNSMFEFERKLEGCGGQLGFSTGGGELDVNKTGGSIAERRAAKFGFNAPKISTPRFRSSSPLPSPGARSPYLTIPSGISPTALLDSPVLLPNSQLSPTTGTFTSPNLDGDNQMFVSEASEDADKGCHGGSSFIFKPVDLIPFASFRAVENQVSSSGDMVQSSVALGDCRGLTSVHPPMDFEFPVQFCKDVDMNNHDTGSPPDEKVSDSLATNGNTILQPCHSDSVACGHMSNELSMEEDSETRNSLDGDHKATYAPTGPQRTAEDGYNWRKYGQKQVKGSEYPRSYYKCTHPNCQMKKKVERSHDGHITEIIYKGTHDHAKPQPCRKSSFGSSLPFGEMSDVGDGSSCVKGEGGSVWRNIQPGCKDVKVGSDWRTDGLEMTSSTSAVTEASDPLSTTQGIPMGVLEAAGTPEFSSTLASHEDDEEDAATGGNISRGDDTDNESDLKRRKKDTCYIETTVGSRAVREPRIVVQIESEIDILDDGYRWRKYGQKVVKGNPNPRSYYKCTSAGCNVRKHVERASQNLKFVITTYEGKHNHEVPAARNSSHSNSGSGSLSQAAANAQSALPIPRNPNLPKPELNVQDLPSHFERNFLRPNYLRNLGGGNSPFYQMNFPNLPNARPYGQFVSNHNPAFPSGLLPAMPNLSIPLPLGFPRSSLGITNYSNPGKPPLSSVQPLLAEENYTNLVRPKQEQGEDSYYDTKMPANDNSNSSSSSVHNHIVGTFPS